MSELHHDVTAGFGKIFDWQKALRAQERLLQGVAAAAALEWRYGQDFAARRLAFLKWDSEVPAPSQRTLEEVEKFITLSREVAEELRGSITEAAKLLSDAPVEASPASPDETEEPQDEAATPKHVLRRTAARAAEAVQH